MASSDGNNHIADAGAEVTITPDNPKAPSLDILKIATTLPEGRKNMGRAGSNYLEKNHVFSRLSEKLAAVLYEVLAEKHGKKILDNFTCN